MMPVQSVAGSALHTQVTGDTSVLSSCELDTRLAVTKHICLSSPLASSAEINAVPVLLSV
jgi:hypothetical protein